MHTPKVQLATRMERITNNGTAPQTVNSLDTDGDDGSIVAAWAYESQLGLHQQSYHQRETHHLSSAGWKNRVTTAGYEPCPSQLQYPRQGWTPMTHRHQYQLGKCHPPPIATKLDISFVSNGLILSMCVQKGCARFERCNSTFTASITLVTRKGLENLRLHLSWRTANFRKLK